MLKPGIPSRLFFYFCAVIPNYVTQDSLNAFISAALAEDVGPGDHSTLASVPKEAKKVAELIIKEDGMIAGVEMARAIFHAVDPSLSMDVLLNDGSHVEKGAVAFTIAGHARSILTAERLVLNCMQRMSAIATKTHYYDMLLEGTGAKLLDTRKTTPNFRLAEKWAVVIGGGMNHRYGLYDMVMLKDNHIDYCGGIRSAIENTVQYLAENGLDLKIEVETRNLDEVRQVLEVGQVHRIMLDNMSLETMKKATAIIGDEFETEASGGITEKTLRDVGLCGVDFISCGALTHHIESMDMSLKATLNK